MSGANMLADILEIKRQLAARPVAQRIYFVDREELHSKFLGFCKEEEPKTPMGMLSAFTGLPVFVLKSSEYNSELPFYCAFPGIWVAMSDGTTILFE